MPISQRSVLLALMFLSGCMATPPAPVIEGQNQKNAQAFRRVESGPAAAPAGPSVATAPAQAFSQPVAPTLVVEDIGSAPRATPRVAAAATTQPLETISPAAGPTAPKPAVENTPYVVQDSDTLYKIARTMKAKPDDILQANNLSSAADIKPGQELVVPSRKHVENTSFSEMIGDYLRQPNAAPRVTEAPAAAQATVQSPTQALEKTQVSKYDVARIEPSSGTPPTPDDTIKLLKHKVVAGETIYRISRNYGVSVLDIMAVNNLDKPEALQKDTEIMVPQVAPAHSGANVATQSAGTAPVAAKDISATKDNAPQGNRPMATLDRGTDDADSLRPLAPSKPVTEAEKIRAELKRGAIDRVAARKPGKIWPVQGKILNTFGDKGRGISEDGLNIQVPENTPVLATDQGVVLYAGGKLKLYGNMVIIKHGNGMISAYSHNKYLLVRDGERVKKGQVIAMSGRSGNAEVPQVHFELRNQARAINPVAVLGPME